MFVKYVMQLVYRSNDNSNMKHIMFVMCNSYIFAYQDSEQFYKR